MLIHKEDFFNVYGDRAVILYGSGGSEKMVDIEDLYQIFKERLLREIGK